MTDFLMLFIGLSIINVIFSTTRSIVTIKGGKTIASLFSGGYFAFYNIMMVYTVADFPMWQKCIITFVCNVIGVYLVKLGEEKATKDKLWKVEVTVKNCVVEELKEKLAEMSSHYVPVGKYTKFEIYCETKEESAKVKEIVKEYGAKYFVAESKIL
jgi:uncharacterized protein YebE (UPF0316 family)